MERIVYNVIMFSFFRKLRERSRLKNQFLLTVAFVSGMCVMAMEISAARLLAPYFGTSIFVWTNVIGVVLVALSLGYYFGGMLADRHPTLNTILIPMLASGVTFVFIPWAVKPLASIITLSADIVSSTLVVFLGSFFVTIILFAIPLGVLGMVSPFVIKLYEVKKDAVGQMAGSVFAVSTIGSILGTFLPTLLFIPIIGTRATITLFASLLILISVIGLARRRFKFAVVPVLLIPILGWPPSQMSANHSVIFEDESAYQYFSIDEMEDGTRNLRFNEGTAVQSVYHPDRLETGYYYDEFAQLPALIDKSPVRVAILGLAGGSISRQIAAEYGDRVHIDGVEIDKKVIEAAKEYFELEQPSMDIYHDDGRLFLEQRKGEYDMVVIDAYSQQIYISWTMTTQEFWRVVSESLTEEGFMVINVNASSDDAPLLTAISNTIASVFEHAYIKKTGRETSWNYMIVAANSEIAVQHAEKIEFDAERPVLTNDWAPVEFMTEKMIFGYLLGF